MFQGSCVTGNERHEAQSTDAPGEEELPVEGATTYSDEF
jgi:hypothetical protein